MQVTLHRYQDPEIFNFDIIDTDNRTIESAFGQIVSGPTPDAARAAIGAASNPNLLDNWYFVGGGTAGKFPVNQRGQTSYSISTNTETTIDRWVSGRGEKITLQPDGIEVECVATSGRSFGQRIEIERVKNTPITFSALVKGTNATAIVRCGTENSIQFQNRANGVNDITLISVSGELTATPDETLAFLEIVNGGNVGDSITIIAAKLELGSVQTLAHQDSEGNWVLNDPPPDYGAELAKCQRYQLVLFGTDAYSTVGSGVVHTATQARIVIPLPNVLRIKPTLSYSGNFQLITDGKGATVTAMTLESMNQNCVSVQAISSGLVVGQAANLRSNSDINAKIILDANL